MIRQDDRHVPAGASPRTQRVHPVHGSPTPRGRDPATRSAGEYAPAPAAFSTARGSPGSPLGCVSGTAKRRTAREPTGRDASSDPGRERPGREPNRHRNTSTGGARRPMPHPPPHRQRITLTMADYVSRDPAPEGDERAPLGAFLHKHEFGAPADLTSASPPSASRRATRGRQSRPSRPTARSGPGTRPSPRRSPAGAHVAPPWPTCRPNSRWVRARCSSSPGSAPASPGRGPSPGASSKATSTGSMRFPAATRASRRRRRPSSWPHRAPRRPAHPSPRHNGLSRASTTPSWTTSPGGARTPSPAGICSRRNGTNPRIHAVPGPGGAGPRIVRRDASHAGRRRPSAPGARTRLPSGCPSPVGAGQPVPRRRLHRRLSP